jgi:hypothetical protein
MQPLLSPSSSACGNPDLHAATPPQGAGDGGSRGLCTADTSNADAPPSTGTCRVCLKPFFRRTTLHALCSVRCHDKEHRQKRKAKSADRKETRAKLESMKPLAQLRAEAQTAFNAFIRARDRLAGHGCICCGAALDWNSRQAGGCGRRRGHFISRGAAIELAFDERNVNAQRKSCNRLGGTSAQKFRAGMVERYGAEVVAELEGPHDLPKLKHDDLRAIRDRYRRKAKDLAREVKA